MKLNNCFRLLMMLCVASGITSCMQETTLPQQSAGLSSVSIALPAQVKNITKARLFADNHFMGYGRTFETNVTSGGNDNTIAFSLDKNNQQLKVGDDLGTVSLILLENETEVYKGTSESAPFTVKAGENSINFSVKCIAPTKCPKGSTLEVLEVSGATSDFGKTPSILAKINVEEAKGMTEQEKREVLTQCQTQLRKKTCDVWGLEYTSGKNDCTKLNAADPQTVCGGAGTFSTCLDDYINICKKLKIVTEK